MPAASPSQQEHDDEDNDEAKALAPHATLVDQRMNELGFTRTLAMGKTITPQTLALLKTVDAGVTQQPTEAEDDARARGVLSESTEQEKRAISDKAFTLEIALTDLPRISIERHEPEHVYAESPGDRTPLRADAIGGGGDWRQNNKRPDYAIVSTLGEGGMGRVHLAHQRSLGRDVALKTLKPGASHLVSTSLLREARITGSLEHPGVIPVHMLGLDESGRPMLVMKRVDGVDLATLVRDNSHPAWRSCGKSADRIVSCLEILMQVCLTIEFAHSRGIIHRDIKPENIMVGGFGEVYLVDWGIATPASEARLGELVGTPLYMAPEMALGRPIDERTDVYLLGATLHEMLTGHLRHEGKSILDVLRSAMTSPPFDYSRFDFIPDELARLCNRATHRDPAKRPASAQELREEMVVFLKHRSAHALSDAAFERLRELEQLLASTPAQTHTHTQKHKNKKDRAEPPTDLARAYRLATEARFGLTESLREHAHAMHGRLGADGPGVASGDGGPLSAPPTSLPRLIVDDTARNGMQRCLALMIELELRQEHADSAEALLREMDPPDPKLRARIEEVRARSEAHAREHERLELLERDLDPTDPSAHRGRTILLFGALVLAIGSLVGIFGSGTSPMRIALTSAVATSILCVGMFLLRPIILTNQFNRRLVALVIFAMVTVLLHRLLALFMNVPADQTMAIDHLIYGAMLIVGAITLTPRLAYCATPFAVGIVLTRLLPEHATVVFVCVVACALLIASVALNVKPPNEPSSGRSK